MPLSAVATSRVTRAKVAISGAMGIEGFQPFLYLRWEFRTAGPVSQPIQ